MKGALQRQLWALRSLGKFPVFHHAARNLFDLFYLDGAVRRIPFGPLSGLNWHCASGVQFWMPLGLYEQETTSWIQAQLGHGDVFFDVGANHGYFSLVGGIAVGNQGRVIAFEPVPACAAVVRRQIEGNAIANVEVTELAICDSVGEATFEVETISANSHFSSVEMTHARSSSIQSVTVPTTTLDEFFLDTGLFPDVVKIDVEGAEVMALQGARKILEKGLARMIVSTHGDSLKRECIEILQGFDYEVLDLPAFRHEIVCFPGRK